MGDYVDVARTRHEMMGTTGIGIDETSAKRILQFIPVMHDLEAQRLQSMMPWVKEQDTVAGCGTAALVYDNDSAPIEHVSMNMSAAYPGASLKPCHRARSAMIVFVPSLGLTRQWPRCGERKFGAGSTGHGPSEG